MIKLNEIKILLLNKFWVGVNKNGEFVEEFKSNDDIKMRKYENGIVSGIHIINENELAVNIEI